MTEHTNRLIRAAKAAADLFRQGDTPDQHEIRELVRAVDGYHEKAGEHKNHTESGSIPGCIMCAVRTLTEGTPRIWTPGTPGQIVAGAVLTLGHTENRFKPTEPFIHVDLWQGGTSRIRVIAYGLHLHNGLRQARPAVGDRLEIRFDGIKSIPSGRLEGRTYREFTVTVTRGHH